MKRTQLKFLVLSSVLSIFIFSSCNDKDMDGTDQGTANVSATDAAIDAENITGVYLTVKGITAASADASNNTTVMLDNAAEFNLMSYQNGEVFDIGSMGLNVGSYESISLILDETKPGYVKFQDNTEAMLEAASEYQVSGDFEIQSNAQTDLVADIDLRKAFRKTSTGEYQLRATGRLVASKSTGIIRGTVDNYNEMKADMESRDVDGKLVVYAYQKGSFSQSEENDADGEGPQGRFENAINSSVVAEDGSFTLAFMEEAQYDIVICSYEKAKNAPAEEPYQFSASVDARLNSDLSLGSLLGDIGVTSQTTTNLNVTVGM